MSKNILSEKLTIIIPCKNEERYIGHLLDALRLQKIGNTRIIIADCSTDSTRDIITNNRSFLNVEIIDGGPVAVARNSAAKLVNTPYILFIDADVIFFDSFTIRDAVFELELDNLDLVGANIRCYENDWRAELSFSIFNQINHILKYFSPFAVGAFMLTKKDKFDEFGGFPEQFTTSEDFFLSSKYDVKKFRIINHYYGQDSRRFKKLGYFGMAWYMIKNFINLKNPSYWKKTIHNKYWS
jgi:glycosyltransferase involved in cell wall biosynthesis